MRAYPYRYPPQSLYRTGQSGAVIPETQSIGSTNATAAGLYGAGGTLNGKTLIVNGITLALSGVGNTANQAAFLAAIAAAFPGVVATIGGPTGTGLVLTQTSGQGLVLGAGSANATLGLTRLRAASIGPVRATFASL